MVDLTDRQKDLLKAIIELYVKTGDAVGSENVEKEFNLGVSPATIRNEMAVLTHQGYLKQPHTSAGRVPTSMGYRVYISELMKEKEVPIAAEVSIKHNLWQKRFEENLVLKEAIRGLATRLRILSMAVNSDQEIFYAGASNILDFPEFEDIDVTRFVLSLFDENPTLKNILGKAVGTEPVHVLFGEDMEFEFLIPTSFVFCRYSAGEKKSGIVGVIGPNRLNFPVVMPYVKYTTHLIEQALKSY